MRKKPIIIGGAGSRFLIPILAVAAYKPLNKIDYKIKIHLKDEGQDLLWFIVDTSNDHITQAGPFHNQIYAGKYVFCPRSLRTGMYVEYSDTPITVMHQPLTRIKYPITKIERL